MKKVLIPTKLDPVAADLLRERGGYTVVQDDGAPLDELAAAHGDAHALIVRSEKVTAAVIDRLPGLKAIIRAGAGYNTIDTKHARSRGIDVMNTPGANANAVAEEVIALILADARHLIAADRTTRAGKWEKRAYMGRELTGKVVGIVGIGSIGQMLMKRLAGFEVTLLGYDPALTEERARSLGLERVDLPELFARCDYVSLHLPENEQTRGMVNRELLAAMKEGATIVNCARAGVVDEEDLRAVRKEKDIRFLNDVYARDVAGPKSVADIADIMVPHIGANTIEANRNAAARAAQQLIEYDDKANLSFVVNRDVPAGLDEAYGELAFAVARLCRYMVGCRRKAVIRKIETSFYGNLDPYHEWLLIPVAAALLESADRSMEYATILQYLRSHGVAYQNRETDAEKRFENSITVDLQADVGDNRTCFASVRGTVTEGHIMISRINDFNKLYFEPYGHHNLIFTYDDRPGVLGRIASALAEQNINIDDVRNPHDQSGKRSLALLKVNQVVSDEVLDSIEKAIRADIAEYVYL